MPQKEITWAEYQKDLFNEIQSLSNKVRQLGSIIQNSIDIGIDEGYISKEQVKESIPEIKKDYLEVVIKLKECREKTINLLEHFSK